jgi:hypothetical protein
MIGIYLCFDWVSYHSTCKQTTKNGTSEPAEEQPKYVPMMLKINLQEL